jgi:hypothetical protein
MCPICLSTAAWLAIGGGSAASLGALLVGWRRKGNDDGDDRNDTPNRDA